MRQIRKTVASLLAATLLLIGASVGVAGAENGVGDATSKSRTALPTGNVLEISTSNGAVGGYIAVNRDGIAQAYCSTVPGVTIMSFAQDGTYGVVSFVPENRDAGVGVWSAPTLVFGGIGRTLSVGDQVVANCGFSLGSGVFPYDGAPAAIILT